MGSFKIINISNILEGIKVVLFMYLGMCICIYICILRIIMEERDFRFGRGKESNEGYMGDFGGRKKKENDISIV